MDKEQDGHFYWDHTVVGMSSVRVRLKADGTNPLEALLNLQKQLDVAIDAQRNYKLYTESSAMSDEELDAFHEARQKEMQRYELDPNLKAAEEAEQEWRATHDDRDPEHTLGIDPRS